MVSAAIEASSLTKRFGKTIALQDIDFTVESGTSMALVGPDGAGKTTTLRIACGLLGPDSGDVTIFGDRPENPAAKEKIGYLSQRFSLYADLSIDENIAFFAEIHGLKHYSERRSRLLEFTRLAAFRSRQAGRLSGGMKQKLALACALVHEPRILIMDEPTTGVDPVSRREFWEIIAELGRDGVTVLAATPYLDEAERFDLVALMDHGRFLALDSPSSLKKSFPTEIIELVSPQARRVTALLESEDFRSRADSGGFSSAQAFGDRVALFADDTETVAAAAISFLRAKGITIESTRKTKPNLEHVFMNLLGGSA